MSAPKFTPGPWRVSEIGQWVEAYDGEATIANVRGFDGCADRNRPDDNANAHMIAAAPDLYSALLDAEVLIDTRSPLAPDVLAKIRAALVKAEGRAP